MSARDRYVSRLIFAIGLTAAHGAAFGAGFQLFEQNASGLGRAFAGEAASADDASTIYFNPAGLTHVKRRQAVGALHLIRPKSEFGDAGSCSPYLGVGAGTSACPFGQPGNLGHAFGNAGGDAGDWGCGTERLPFVGADAGPALARLRPQCAVWFDDGMGPCVDGPLSRDEV